MNLTLGDTQLLIAEGKRQGLLRNQMAYVLATVYHETAHTIKPIKEMGGLKYLKSKKYYPYFGRGYAQLTWDYNYIKAGKKLGVDFIKSPELLLEPKYAVPICITGMKEGWFTGKKLSNYVTLQESDFVNARRIINGTDDAKLIAGYAKDYDNLLEKSGYGLSKPQEPIQTIPEVSAVVQPPKVEPTVTPPTAPVEPKNSWVNTLINIAMVLFNGKAGR